MFVQIMLRVIDSRKNLILIIVKIVSNLEDEFNFKILYLLNINIYNVMPTLFVLGRVFSVTL